MAGNDDFMRTRLTKVTALAPSQVEALVAQPHCVIVEAASRDMRILQYSPEWLALCHGRATSLEDQLGSEVFGELRSQVLDSLLAGSSSIGHIVDIRPVCGKLPDGAWFKAMLSIEVLTCASPRPALAAVLLRNFRRSQQKQHKQHKQQQSQSPTSSSCSSSTMPRPVRSGSIPSIGTLPCIAETEEELLAEACSTPRSACSTDCSQSDAGLSEPSMESSSPMYIRFAQSQSSYPSSSRESSRANSKVRTTVSLDDGEESTTAFAGGSSDADVDVKIDSEIESLDEGNHTGIVRRNEMQGSARYESDGSDGGSSSSSSQGLRHLVSL